MNGNGNLTTNSLRAILFLLVFSIFIPLGRCQAQTSFASPEEAAKALQGCTGDGCKALSAALHLSFGFDPKTCPYPEYAMPLKGAFERDHSDALVTIKCSYDFELVVLTRDPDGRWVYLDSVYLGATYDYLTLTLARVVSPAEDDIVVHDDVIVHGTGIYQADFLILRITNRKLQIVLDAVEKGVISPYGESGDSVEQESKFSVVPATDKGPGTVNETETLNVGGKRTSVLEREFDWRKDFGIFEPSFWGSVQRASKSAPKKRKK